MLRTRVGYSGGTTPSPTYHSIGNHSEAIEVDFDPEVLSYEDLVAIVFKTHNPCYSAWSTQYRTAVFTRTPEQRKAAQAALGRAAEARGKPSRAAVEDFTGFTLAEDYHQKYRLRAARAVLAEFQAMFPTTQALLGSTAVTRANAFLGGYGATAQRRDEIPKLGLTPEAQAIVRDRLR